MASGFLSSERALNIAHRGASAVAPENTLPAFEKALELGADGIELDVRLCADGVPVVIHNATVDATTDSSGSVAEMTLPELKRLDAGGWFGPAFADTRIPTLEETLAAVGNRLLLNIELKGDGLLGDGLVRAVTELIETFHLVERVVISSFNPVQVHRVQRISPSIPTGLLYLWSFCPTVAQLISPRPYTALHPSLDALTQAHAAWIRRNGYRIHVWTVDDPADMRRLIRWGVDAIITNVPDVLDGLLKTTAEAEPDVPGPGTEHRTH